MMVSSNVYLAKERLPGTSEESMEVSNKSVGASNE